MLVSIRERVPNPSFTSSHLRAGDLLQDALHLLIAAVLREEGHTAELGRHSCALGHDKDLLGYLPFMSLLHFHELFVVSLNLLVENILLVQNCLSSESILDTHLGWKFVMKLPIISLFPIY